MPIKPEKTQQNEQRKYQSQIEQEEQMLEKEGQRIKQLVNSRKSTVQRKTSRSKTSPIQPPTETATQVKEI